MALRGSVEAHSGQRGRCRVTTKSANLAELAPGPGTSDPCLSKGPLRTRLDAPDAPQRRGCASGLDGPTSLKWQAKGPFWPSEEPSGLGVRQAPGIGARASSVV